MKRHWLSLTALLIALIAIIVVCYHHCCVHGGVVDTTTKDYIGMMITLLGVVITFVVGFQVYNAVDYKDRLKQLEEKKDGIEKSQSELNKRLDDFNEKQKHFENFSFEMRSEMNNAAGIIAEEAKNYPLAIPFFSEAIYYAFKGNNKDGKLANISCLRTTLILWKKTAKTEETHSVLSQGEKKDPINEAQKMLQKIIEEFNSDEQIKNVIELKTKLEEIIKSKQSK